MNIPTGSESFRKLNPHLCEKPYTHVVAPKDVETVKQASLQALKPIQVETLRANPDMTIKPCTDEGNLNKTEKAYLARLRMTLPKGAYIGIQNMTLKLGDNCRFTPDFTFIDCNGRFTFVDVKGFQRDDALVKIKVAARMFRWADFTIVKKNGAAWDVNLVSP